LADFDFGSFWITVIGTLVAAFAGGWAAQQVTMRREDRREHQAEITALNAAATLAVVVANKFLSVKSQHVGPQTVRYKAELQAYQEFLQPHQAQEPGPRVFSLTMDLKQLEPVDVPIAPLAQLCFEKIRLPPRAMAAVSDLQTTIAALSAAMRERNRMIEEHRTLVPPRSTDAAAKWYLGAPNDAGHRDERFRDTALAIGDYCDDCIFFSALLADDIASYGKLLRREHWWRFQRMPHVRSAADWKRAVDQMPPRSNYANWLAGFPTRKNWWQRLRARFATSNPAR